MRTSKIQAIDVHGHFGKNYSPDIGQLLSADAATVARRAKEANIKITIVSPLAGLMPRGQADVFQANEQAAQIVCQTEGLKQYVIVHPRQPRTYHQAAEMLYQPQCVGIKIHPEEHVYPIVEFGDELFEFAAQHDATVLAHTGDVNSHPAHFVTLANEYPNVKLILAHLGNGGAAGGDPGLQVRAIQKSRQNNVWVDTSSSRSIVPGLIEWAVSEIGSDKILFGTDTPLYSTAMQRVRIDSAEISDEDKYSILCDNAEQLFSNSLIESDTQRC
ncbi:amidohydrolase family protein [Bythopirellula goksoeyrii]|uniref:Amidohydrolase n=1 Tax=Bythopirellula goksoeyrii TaxID=1400387 RepID=A0A5B9Q337_9BACT|nr:amidohydrolase family protein [Bythopirellula goksoeyrii]QEG33414.1 Amidohydrolase [Bythopirellula goksoeyrii]